MTVLAGFKGKTIRSNFYFSQLRWTVIRQFSYATFLEFKRKNLPQTVGSFICPCEALEWFQFEKDCKNLEFVSSAQVIYKT